MLKQEIHEFIAKNGTIDNATKENGEIRKNAPYAGNYNKEKQRKIRRALGIKLPPNIVH